MTMAREEDEKKLAVLKARMEAQKTRLQDLQSTAFQLANYYFVFQGVILTAICNGSTSLKCSDRWFLFTVSLLAASLNLVALSSTGLKYIRNMNQRDRYWSESNEIERRLQTDHRHHNNNAQPSPMSSSSYVTARPYLSPFSPLVGPPLTKFADRFKELKRYFWLGVGMALFAGFAGVTLSGCWVFLCGNDYEIEPEDMPGTGSVHKCIKFCARGGGGCIKICD